MDACIIALSCPPTVEARHYVAQLAQLLAVPMLETSLEAVLPPGFRAQPRFHSALSPPLPPLQPSATATATVPLSLLCTPAQVLLLALPRPPARRAAALMQQLLRALALPLLVVPSPAAGRMPPRRIALAAEGEPLVLEQGLRTLHALLLTLPTQLTVLHAQLPHGIYSAADALHAVQACGLAVRHLPINVQEVSAPNAVAGILAGVQQLAADLLVVPVRPRSQWGPAFKRSVTARLLAQSPVPVLLLPVRG